MNYYVNGENVNGRPCRGVVHVVKGRYPIQNKSRVYDESYGSDLDESRGVRIL